MSYSLAYARSCVCVLEVTRQRLSRDARAREKRLFILECRQQADERAEKQEKKKV